MQTTENLKSLYNNTLRPLLIDLERKRIGVRNMGILCGFFATITIFSFFTFASIPEFHNLIQLLNISIITNFVEEYNGNNRMLKVAWFTLSITIALGVYFYVLFMIYKRSFKGQIVRKVFKVINPSFIYSSKNMVGSSTYEASKIFTKCVDRYRGDNHIKGVLDKTAFEMSELHTEYRVRTKNAYKYYNIFKGLFLVADFNKNIIGETVVLPNLAEKTFGKVLGKFLQSKNYNRGDLVKFENITFEKEFVVYSNDQINARYILTPAMMEAILRFKKKSKRQISLSFTGNKVYVALSYSKNLFEPRIFTTGVNFQDIKEIHDLLSLCTTNTGAGTE